MLEQRWARFIAATIPRPEERPGAYKPLMKLPTNLPLNYRY
jgi:hypothetical protein